MPRNQLRDKSYCTRLGNRILLGNSKVLNVFGAMTVLTFNFGARYSMM